MSDFESYVPKGKPTDATRFHMNVFSEGKKSSNQKPNYTVVYGTDIENYGYNKPGVRTYNMNVKDAQGKIAYEGFRRDHQYEMPNEEYGKPPVLKKGNYMAFQNEDFGYGMDTTTLGSFIGSVQQAKQYLGEIKNSSEYSKYYPQYEKVIIYTLADMQRVWSGDGNYNKDIIPTAGKVNNKQAFRNALDQLQKPIPSDEKMFDQYSLGENPNKIICRDYAVVTARIAKQLGFEAVAGTIEVGVSHAFTVVRSPDTGTYYGISADSVGGDTKIFEGKSLTEIRSNYQNHLLSLGRVPHFGGVFLDDNGKVTGKWQSDIERRRSKDFLGGDTPTRLLKESLGTDITLNQGKVGSIDYTSLIAQKGINIPGTTIDSDIFFRGGITRMGLGESTANAVDMGIGAKLSTKPLEIREGMTVRAYIAADINASVGHSSEKGTQIPYLSGNTVIGGELKYVSGKWSFTTDLGKSYELSGPNQMQHPLMKLLPSGEYAIFSGEYKGDSANVLGKAVFENYFTTQRRELSLGIRTKNDFVGSIYTRDTKNMVAGFPDERTQEMGLGIGGSLKKDVDWKVEAGRKKGTFGSSNSVNAGISIKF
ncbi:hypothetical protein K2X92_04265 [Candidatus Gracilibacteria bacterium]|nr:hypothetical protein [Candidatus Gracilibacteria bacterium]